MAIPAISRRVLLAGLLAAVILVLGWAAVSGTDIEANWAPGLGPDMWVDAGQRQGAISSLIYGMNFAEEALAAELQLPINRWGGNATTRFNWQRDLK